MFPESTLLDIIFKPFLIVILIGFSIMMIGANMNIFEIADAYQTFKIGVTILSVTVVLFFLTILIDAFLWD